MDMIKLQEVMEDREAWHAAVHGVTKSRTGLAQQQHRQSLCIVNETEVDVFLEFLSFPYDPENVGNLISGSSSFSKSLLDIWKFLVRIMPKPGMQNFKHDLASMGRRRHWHPTPVLLPGKSHGQRSLVGCSP